MTLSIRRPLIQICLILAVLLGAMPLLRAQDLVVDLSNPVVAITTGFAGTDLLLFGAASGDGDVVIVIRGPQQDHIVRRKEQVAGIWINRDEVRFTEIPSFYWISANRPVEEIVPFVDAGIHQIGERQIDFRPHERQKSVDDITEFRDALIRLKQRSGLYSREPTDLIFLGNGLFRTNVHFPANVAVGTYGIDAYLFKDGELLDSQTTLLNVRKFGLEAGIYDFAQRHASAYGVLAVIMAAVAGWIASVAFRKG